jgi:hypothetical protein
MRAALPGMRAWPAALLVLVLAGCSEAPEAVDERPSAASPSSTAAVEAPQPTVEVVPFSFEGNLGTFVHGCVIPAGQCTDPYGTVVAGETDLFIERPGANLTALAFEMSWTSRSPATQELWVGSMVMASCEGCNSTSFQDAHGPSPVRVDIQGVSVPLTADARVHIYVYNPNGFVYDPAVPAYGGGSVDEAFRIEGTATFLVPPA